MVPLSCTFSSVSKISNTLSAATIPICITLNLSAIWRKGLYNMVMYILKATNCPIVVSVSPLIIQMAPKYTTKPILILEIISAIGKKMELYRMFFNQALLCFWLISSNFSNSIFSRLKSCTIFIPVNRSWMNVFRLATSFRTSLKATFIFLLKMLVAIRITGIITSTIPVVFQFITSIKAITIIILSTSLTIINNPWLKILAMDSISETERVTNFPTGSLSKYFILNEEMWWYNLSRKSLIISCPNQLAK